MGQVCLICKTGKPHVIRPAGAYHRDCMRMQRKGLLWTGTPVVAKDSTGKPCFGCGDLIDGPHAHRNGFPFHRECLY